MVIAEVPELKPSRIIDEHQELWLDAELAARVVPPIFRQSLRTALFPDFEVQPQFFLLKEHAPINE
jgi:hypothetical protein